MKRTACPSYPVSIFIAGEPLLAKAICQRYCDANGLCVTVTPTSYVYTGGAEDGVIVGLINYPRFPKEPAEILALASGLAEQLCQELGQQSYTIMTPVETIWISHREQDAQS